MPLNINSVGSSGIGGSGNGIGTYVSEPDISEELKLSYGSIAVDMNSIGYTSPLVSKSSSNIAIEDLAIPQIQFKNEYYGFQRYYNTYSGNIYKCTLNSNGSITRTIVASVNRICDNSWFVCGNYMWFIDGNNKLYRYDGSTCTDIMSLPTMYTSSPPTTHYNNVIPMNDNGTKVLIIHKIYGQIDYGGYSILKVSPDGYIINSSFGIDPNNKTIPSKLMSSWIDYIKFVTENKMIIAELGQDMNKSGYPGTITWKEYNVTFNETRINGVLTYPCTRTLIKTILSKKTMKYNRICLAGCNIIGNSGNVFLTASTFYSSSSMLIECFYQISVSDDGTYSIQIKNNSDSTGSSFGIPIGSDGGLFTAVACRLLDDELMLYNASYDTAAGWSTYQLSCNFTANNSGNSICNFTGTFTKGDTIITATEITHISNTLNGDNDVNDTTFKIPEDGTYTVTVKTLDDLKTPPMIIRTNEGILLHTQLIQNTSGNKDYANLISNMKVNENTLNLSGNQDITAYKKNERYVISF